MRMRTSATIDIARPRDAVFDFACACETYVELFRPRGSVAGVAKAEMMGGVPLGAGARRRIELTDGAIVEEDVVAFDRPTRHTYRWNRGLRMPAKLLVRAGEGDWTFRDESGGTRIDWIYTFDLTTPVVYPLALVMRGQFQRWMEQQLRAIAKALTT
jgi:Polyketide cyclase / dehydrase and lipid transport